MLIRLNPARMVANGHDADRSLVIGGVTPFLEDNAVLSSIIHSFLSHTLSSPLTLNREDHHSKGAVPATKGTEEGSAKRNIQRKHNPNEQKEKKQHGGGGGKGKWNDLDDGSMP